MPGKDGLYIETGPRSWWPYDIEKISVWLTLYVVVVVVVVSYPEHVIAQQSSCHRLVDSPPKGIIMRNAFASHDIIMWMVVNVRFDRCLCYAIMNILSAQLDPSGEKDPSGWCDRDMWHRIWNNSTKPGAITGSYSPNTATTEIAPLGKCFLISLSDITYLIIKLPTNTIN